MRFPVFYGNGPSLMIAPTSSKLQILRRVSFQSETALSNELARRFVVRLNVRFEPMQPVPTKRFHQNSAKSFLHITPPVVWHEGVVSKVTGTENAAHNLRNVDYASQ